MTRISLAMIVKNEEATLAHCLESVRPLADEMIIVDTGSTDGTVGIARGLGAQVRHFKWRDDFAAARNESLKYCKGDWVLILDGDEAIDPLDYEKIRGACANSRADAYLLIARHYMIDPVVTLQDSRAVPNESIYGEGKNLPFYADTRVPRLARRTEYLSFTGGIHETFDASVLSRGGAIAELDAVIHHYGKLFNDREEYKSRYYLMLSQREVEKKPKDMQARYNLLQQALCAKEWKLAAEAAAACMALSPAVNPFVLYGCGLALAEDGRHKEAVKYFDALLGKDPKNALAMLRKGSSCKALGNIDAGRRLMKGAIALEPTCVQAYGMLAELEFDENNFDAARRTALEAIKAAPNELAYNLLLKIELARGNHRQAARDAMSGLKDCPAGGGGLWHRLAAVHLLGEGDAKTAASILESGLKAFPGDPDLARLGKITGGSRFDAAQPDGGLKVPAASRK